MAKNRLKSLIYASEASFHLNMLRENFQTVDVVQVQNMAKKAKNPCRCSKISLHKNFKLILEQNVTEQTYLKLNYRWQKCWVQLKIQQFYVVNWILISNTSWKLKMLEHPVLNDFLKFTSKISVLKPQKSVILNCERNELHLNFQFRGKNDQFMRVFENLKLAVKQCYPDRSI